MASVFRGNVIIADTATGESVPPFDYGDSAPYDYSRSAVTASLQKYPIKLKAVLIKQTGPAATLKLQDGGNASAGVDPITLLDLATSDATNDSSYFQLDTPIFFPSGIIIEEITNCTAHLIVELPNR